MKRFELEQDDLEETVINVDQEDGDFDDTETEHATPASQKAIWREIEKRRELMALSRMIGESLDDRIFN